MVYDHDPDTTCEHVCGIETVISAELRNDLKRRSFGNTASKDSYSNCSFFASLQTVYTVGHIYIVT